MSWAYVTSCPFGLGTCILSLGSHDVYCLATGICWAYVWAICIHNDHNNSLIRIALSVVRPLLELLEAL